MKDLIKEAKRLALSMAVIWFMLFTFAALGNSIITAFYGMRWVEMDLQDRVMVMILIFVNWATVMMAFFSKAISRVSRGESPITEGGDTQLIQRTSVAKVTEIAKVDG